MNTHLRRELRFIAVRYPDQAWIFLVAVVLRRHVYIIAIVSHWNGSNGVQRRGVGKQKAGRTSFVGQPYAAGLLG